MKQHQNIGQIQKATMRYHRSHRRLTFTWDIVLGAVLSLAAACAFFIFKIVSLPELTRRAAELMQRLFAGTGILPEPAAAGGTLLDTLEAGGAFLSLPVRPGYALTAINVTPAMPSAMLCLIVCGTALLSFAVLYRLPLSRPLVIIVNMLAFIMGGFAALFLLLPGSFDAGALSLPRFFLEIALVTGLSLPFLFWLALFPLPAGPVLKLFCMVALEAVLAALFLLKYALFVVLCAYGTYLIAPLIIFFLCSLADVTYMIALFSFVTSRISRKAAKNTRFWQWA